MCLCEARVEKVKRSQGRSQEKPLQLIETLTNEEEGMKNIGCAMSVLVVL